MGSKKSNAEFGYIDDLGNFVKIGEIPYEIPEVTIPIGTHSELPYINTSLTFRCRTRHQRTRKRFVKYLMGHGYSRNEDNNLAALYHRYGYTWEQAFLDLALWSV